MPSVKHTIARSQSAFRGTKLQANLTWMQCSFRLISLAEMVKVILKEIYECSESLKNVSLDVQKRKWTLRLSDSLETFLKGFEVKCKTLGLPATAGAARRLALCCAQPDQLATTVCDRFIDLHDCLWDELDTHLFLWVSYNRAENFNQDAPLFGNAVHERFPTASTDITEVGKCYACGRSTAAVMHCMRVLEHGLRALSAALQLPFGEGTWKRSIQAIEKRIAVLDSQAKQKTAWKKKRQFYSEAATEFLWFKDAWRNYAAHGHEHYTDERAEKIVEHTRKFMQHLAERMSEPKKLTRP